MKNISRKKTNDIKTWGYGDDVSPLWNVNYCRFSKGQREATLEQSEMEKNAHNKNKRVS